MDSYHRILRTNDSEATNFQQEQENWRRGRIYFNEPNFVSVNPVEDSFPGGGDVWALELLLLYWVILSFYAPPRGQFSGEKLGKGEWWC